MKTCIKCDEAKDFAEFSKNKARSDGLDAMCRACMKLKNKASYAAHAEKRRAYAKTYGQENKEHRAEYQKKYVEEHKEELAEYGKEWRAANPDKVAVHRERGMPRRLEQMKERYATDTEYKEKVKAASRQWRLANPEKHKENLKSWLDTNRVSYREYARKYTSERKISDPTWHARSLLAQTVWRHRNWHKEVSGGPGWIRRVADRVVDQSVIKRLHAWQADFCYFCNNPMKECTLEHVVPRERGGGSLAQNLALTCKSCNYSRQHKIFHLEWQPKEVATDDKHILLRQKTIGEALSKAGISNALSADGSWVLQSSIGEARPLFIVSTFFGSARNPGSSGGKVASWIQENYHRPIVLFDYEWNNRRESCLNMLKSKMGISVRAPGARKLDIVEVSAHDAQVFLDSHHVMGNMLAPVRIGLTDGTTLFGLSLFTDRGESWECARLAFHGHVPGGMSKIMKALWNQYGARPIRSFVDSRYADGAGHETVGFQSSGMSPESHQWVLPDRVQHQRYLSNDNKMSRNLLYFSPNAAREDNIAANGVYKIWTPKRHIIVWTP